MEGGPQWLKQPRGCKNEVQETPTGRVNVHVFKPRLLAQTLQDGGTLVKWFENFSSSHLGRIDDPESLSQLREVAQLTETGSLLVLYE